MGNQYATACIRINQIKIGQYTSHAPQPCWRVTPGTKPFNKASISIQRSCLSPEINTTTRESGHYVRDEQQAALTR